METETQDSVGPETVSNIAMDGLVQYAHSEFAVAAQKRDMTQLTPETVVWIDKIESAVVQMLTILESLPAGDSSRRLAISLFGRLSTFQVITPLTGEDGEWVDSGKEGLKVNRRCLHVFLREDGTAYDDRAIIRLASDGSMQPQSLEPKDITFPYLPKQEVLGPQQAPDHTEVPVGAA